jgi:hypothetical protein
MITKKYLDDDTVKACNFGHMSDLFACPNVTPKAPRAPDELAKSVARARFLGES